MRIVECSDPARALDKLEAAAEALDAVLRYSKTDYLAMSVFASILPELHASQRMVDETISEYFEVRE